MDENRRKYAGNRAGWVHLLRGKGAEARTQFERVHVSHAVDEESLHGSGRYQFFVDGSTYRHTLLMAVSHWAEDDTTATAAELSRGEALAGDGFITDLREYAELLRSLRETTEPGIGSRSYELILGMLDELAPGDSSRQAAEATTVSTTGV